MSVGSPDGSPAVVTASSGRLLSWAQRHSLWPLAIGGCCAVGMMEAFSPRHDVTRLGAEIRRTPEQADLLIVSGRISLKMGPVLKQIYLRMPEPRWVMALGACASSGGLFDTYATVQGADQFLPVDVYVPGCPPRPEDLIEGLLLLQEGLQRRG